MRSATPIDTVLEQLDDLRETLRAAADEFLPRVETLLELDARAAQEAWLRARTLTKPDARVGGEWEQLRDALRRVVSGG